MLNFCQNYQIIFRVETVRVTIPVHVVLHQFHSLVLPVCVQHVSGELLSLQQQVLDGSLCFSRLSLKSCSGVCQLLSHDSEKINTSISST